MSYEPLFRAVADPRGCGERTPGGLYVESGLGPGGLPLEYFLVDPPLPVPEGLDLVNKPQIVEDRETSIAHLWLWIGAEWYPYCPDYIEETRRLGASRKLNPQLDLSRLTPGSRMILVHPKARNSLWQQQRPPYACAKQVPSHALELDFPAMTAASVTPLSPASTEVPETLDLDETAVSEESAETNLTLVPSATDSELVPLSLGWRRPFNHSGPCLFKTYELIPRDAAADADLPSVVAGHAWYARVVGSTTYFYEPSGETAEGLESGVFAALPITGFALIQHPDGSVDDQAKAKLDTSGLPYYTSDR